MTEHKMVRYIWISMLMMVMTWSVSITSAHAWWNGQWEYRKKIAIDTTASGADIQQNMQDFPVLIRLHSGNFDFTKTKENGDDLRIVSSDDLTLLKYHIELYDAFDEIALVWVKVPAVSGANNQGHVWLYYGNEEAASGSDPKNTFDPHYLSVFHFNEYEGTPQDVSTYSTHSSEYTGGLGLAGAIGNGGTFSGSGNSLVVADNPAINFSGGFTFSAWIKMFQPQENAWIFSRMSGDKGIIIAVRGTKAVVKIADGTQVYETEATADIPLEGWHHLAVSMASKGRATLYIDGIQAQWVETQMDLSTASGDIRIGADAQGVHSFSGDLDEIRISGTARSQGWIRAAYASQGSDARMLAFSLEEISEDSGSGMPIFYLATIFQNITIDGLFVIGMLLILSGLSWVVMISKGLFLYNTSKVNKEFLIQYNQAEDPMGVEIGTERFDGSGFYRIYEAGVNCLDFSSVQPAASEDMETVESDAQETPTVSLSDKKIDKLKAVLEEGLVEESKKLNAWLIVLTMSISGGPFLGLLGTVWGVMNTFAAMAEAGEANIMAIAPGVASALSTTVFGLIVAIPALFGYNFLASKIRDLTADCGIFVDQFALKVDAAYGREL